MSKERATEEESLAGDGNKDNREKSLKQLRPESFSSPTSTSIPKVGCLSIDEAEYTDHGDKKKGSSEEKRLSRIMANRRSARESRERRKRIQAKLESSISTLTSEHAELIRQNEELRSELKEMLAERVRETTAVNLNHYSRQTGPFHLASLQPTASHQVSTNAVNIGQVGPLSLSQQLGLAVPQHNIGSNHQVIAPPDASAAMIQQDVVNVALNSIYSSAVALTSQGALAPACDASTTAALAAYYPDVTSSKFDLSRS